MFYEYQIICIFIKDLFSAVSSLRTLDTLTSFHGSKIQNTYVFLFKNNINKYMFCGLKFGILIMGEVLVLLQKAVEIDLSLDFVKKKFK